MGYWRDSTTLFRRALEVTRDNWLAHGNLAIGPVRKGRPEGALTHQREVVRLRPGFPAGRAALARTLAASGMLREAATEYQQALRLDPRLVDAAIGLAQVMEEMRPGARGGQLFPVDDRGRPGRRTNPFRLGRLPPAAWSKQGGGRCYRRGLEANPLNAAVRNTLATALAGSGRLGEAETSFGRRSGPNPALIEPRRNLAC